MKREERNDKTFPRAKNDMNHEENHEEVDKHVESEEPSENKAP